MNKSLRKLLRKVYASNCLPAPEVVGLVENKTGDHRDFYPLVALIEGNYLGFTGGLPADDEELRSTLIARTLQCYRQGPGKQSYKNVTVFRREGVEEDYFHICPKAIEFFESRRSDTKKLLASAGLSFFAAVTVAVINFWLKGSGAL